jgi:hypothetical protein
MRLAAVRRPGSFSKWTYDSATPFASFTMKQALFQAAESGGLPSRFIGPPQGRQQDCRRAGDDKEQIQTDE